MTDSVVYKPRVLSLKQLCTIVVIKNKRVLGDTIKEIPTILKQYIKKTTIGIVYTGVVDCSRERTMGVWMEVYRNGKEKYNALVGKAVFHCFTCSRVDFCNLFIRDYKALNYCSFPDSTPKCFCCGSPALFTPLHLLQPENAPSDEFQTGTS